MIVDEFIKAAEKDVKIKTIIPQEIFMMRVKEKLDQIQDTMLKGMIKKNLEVRVLECDYDFILIDEYITHIPIPDPVEPKKMFGELKVYDKEYAGKLKAKFEELWAKGQKVDLEL